MFLAIQIAEYLVRKGLKENKPLTMLQVIKLAFISEGYMLEPIFMKDIFF
jgi:uncharacterized phage-associated protein